MCKVGLSILEKFAVPVGCIISGFVAKEYMYIKLSTGVYV